MALKIHEYSLVIARQKIRGFHIVAICLQRGENEQIIDSRTYDAYEYGSARRAVRCTIFRRL